MPRWRRRSLRRKRKRDEVLNDIVKIAVSGATAIYNKKGLKSWEGAIIKGVVDTALEIAGEEPSSERMKEEIRNQRVHFGFCPICNEWMYVDPGTGEYIHSDIQATQCVIEA